MSSEKTSLILSWENPTDLYVPAARQADLYRTSPGMIEILAMTDIPWGYVEDTHTSNCETMYRVVYKNSVGTIISQVQDEDIRRFNRPDGMCRIEFALTQPDGGPDSGRVIEISDEPSGVGAFVRKLVTNRRGKATFFSRAHARLLFRLEGDAKALDVEIPDVRGIMYNDLIAHGTLLDTDPRSSIG